MRVLLADPPAKGTKFDDSYPNLGLLYLAGSIRAGLGDTATGRRIIDACAATPILPGQKKGGWTFLFDREMTGHDSDLGRKGENIG